jgi:ATP-dependent protease ClpP protease subunit
MKIMNDDTVYIKFSQWVDLNSIEKLTNLVLEQLENGAERINLLMSSPGGNVDAGISGYNFLNGIPAEIVTHNYGSVGSIAAVLFCAGSKRYSVPHATFILHGVTLDVKAHLKLTEKSLKEQMSSMKADREIMSRVISNTTRRDYTQVDHDILEGIVLNSEHALEYGLIHDVKTELFEKGVKVLNIGG